MGQTWLSDAVSNLRNRFSFLFSWTIKLDKMWRIYLGMSLFPNHVADVRFWARRIVQEFVESFRRLNCTLRSLFWKDSYIIYRSLVAKTICSFKIKFFCRVTLSQEMANRATHLSKRTHPWRWVGFCQLTLVHALYRGVGQNQSIIYFEKA